MKCIVSCEHATNRVPPRFAHLLVGRDKVLSSHQAYDPGAAALARRIARQVQSSVHLGTVTRLLIDLNRSPSNRKTLYTKYSRELQQGDRELLYCKYYLPYRELVEREVGRFAAKGKPVVHISVHSFSPVKGGKVRKADVGLLYDPARRNEKAICGYLAALLQGVDSLSVRRNYPYLGKTDGFTSYLRKKFSEKQYAGIEIEMNLAFLSSGNKKKKKVEEVLMAGISKILRLQDFSKLAKNIIREGS